MSFKSTWFWLLAAVGLFAFIYFFHPHPAAPVGPAKILPLLQPAAVTSIQLRPGGDLRPQILAEHTNASWTLLQPLVYPAADEQISNLLAYLAQLTPATYITPEEIRQRPDADAQYGFTTPQASIILYQGNYRAHILVGATTPPGDQLFLQVVSDQGVYIVDSALLKLLPKSANDWRDRSVLDLANLSFTRLAVTNTAKEPGVAGATFVVERDPTNSLWHLVWPFTRGARADNQRIESALQSLQSLKIQSFCSDSANPDLEAFGLARPQLELALGQGTNTLALLQFGRPATNDAKLLYARRLGQNTIFTVPNEPLAAFQRPSLNDFRDPHLLTVTEPIQRIEVHGEDSFSLAAEPNGSWRILPEGLRADTFAVSQLLFILTNMPIVQFVKDVVNEPDLPQFGLAKPLRQYILFSSNSLTASNPTPLVDLSFGSCTNDQVFVRRADESPVYAVSTNEFARLPSLSWTLRQRQLFQFCETNLAGLTLRVHGKQRSLLRRGPYQWSLAPGSQGIINDLAVEQAVRGLTQATALSWVGRGQTNLLQCGFAHDGYQIVFDLLNGEHPALQFGGQAPSGDTYAAIQDQGQTWVCLLPADLYRLVNYSLSVE